MKFAIYGAGAIGAYLGAKLSLAGEDVVAHCARAAPGGDAGARGVVVRSPDGDFTAKVFATNDAAEVGHRRRRGAGGEGARAHRPSRRCSPPLIGPGHGRPARAERHSVVVLPAARRIVGRDAAGERRPRRRHHRARPRGEHRRVRGVPRRDHRGAGRHRARGGQPLLAGGAGRDHVGAGPRPSRRPSSARDCARRCGGTSGRRSG